MALALVQSGSVTNILSGTATNVFPASTRQGNTIVAAVAVSGGSTLTNITQGGTTFTATSSKNSTSTFLYLQILPRCTGGTKQMTVTSGSGSDSTIFAFEVFGMYPGTPTGDNGSSALSTTSTWSSAGTSPGTTFYTEFMVGLTGQFNPGTLTGPASPWTNLAQTTDSNNNAYLCGWQITSAQATSIIYNGTATTWTQQGATIVESYAASENYGIASPALQDVIGNSVTTGQAINASSLW